jgi:hypothetical protein
VTCDGARLAVSLRADGELDGDDPAAAGLDDHLATCPDCRRFEAGIARTRAALRVEPVGEAPDIAGAVVRRLSPRHRAVRDDRRPWAAAAVALVAGLVAGATFVGVAREPQSPAAADLPTRVVAAQAGVDTLDAGFRLTESTRPAPRDGRLAYRAPESLALTVGDDRLVVDGDGWWRDAARACSPAPGRVRCPDPDPRWVTAVTGREPFSPATPVPLDLIVPVDSFALAAATGDLGTRTVAGRDAVGVTVTAAQAAPFLDGLAGAGGLRPVHPADPVAMWLDADHLVPLAVTVRAGDDPGRAAWAAAAGVADAPGTVIVDFAVTEVTVNHPVDGGLFAPPAGDPADATDAGFRPGDGGVAPEPGPGGLPPGFRPHRAGTVTTPGGPDVGVRSWTDGRAWVTVRATAGWAGGRLFGDLGPDVRPVDLGAGGRAYASADGRRVALHTAGLDVVVSGSVPAADLRAVAAALGVVGQPVPSGWPEAATATVAAGARVVPGLLRAGPGLDGFGPAAVRVDGDTVTQVYAGPGERGFALVQRVADHLPPPGAGDEVGVTVRGAAGRYSYARGQLDWVEGGAARSLRSPTLGLGELLAVAEGLAPA